jgi:uncharacterized membrane protein
VEDLHKEASELVQIESRSRLVIHEHETIGQRTADAVAAGMGSWRFIIVQTGLVVCWVFLNLVAWVHHWDVYPFILLNLLFSTQAAYAAPMILMSGNRAAFKDRKRDDLEAQEIRELYQMNRLQIKMLTLLHRALSIPPSPEDRDEDSNSN